MLFLCLTACITNALVDSDLQHSNSKQIINRMSLFDTRVSLLQPLSLTSVLSHSLTETFDRTHNFRLSACLHLCTLDGAFCITLGTLVLVGIRLLLVIIYEDHSFLLVFYRTLMQIWKNMKQLLKKCRAAHFYFFYWSFSNAGINFISLV